MIVALIFAAVLAWSCFALGYALACARLSSEDSPIWTVDELESLR